MGRNLEKDAAEMALKNQRILANGFRIFSQQTIDKVKMTDISEAAGIAISSLYRYYSTKQKLATAISAWVWGNYTNSARIDPAQEVDMTAAEEFDYFLESFLDLYRNHKDILRFNQFYNVYIQSEGISEEEKQPFTDVINALERWFETVYRKGQRDGTLRTELPEKQLFSATLHLMLAAVTRYAVGLLYEPEGAADPTSELILLKEMIKQKFTIEKPEEK